MFSMSKYDYIKKTGIGAGNIPWCGKKIIFDKHGNYPKGTLEYKIQKLKNKFTIY